MDTLATSGNISTQYFGDKFNVDKIDGFIYIYIRVEAPSSVKGDENITLMFDMTKETIKFFSYLDKIVGLDGPINTDHWSRNITAPDTERGYPFTLDRTVSKDAIRNDMMPGFRLSWKYNIEPVPEAGYSSLQSTKEFVR